MSREQALADAIEEASESGPFMALMRRINKAQYAAVEAVMKEAFQDGTMTEEVLAVFVNLLNANTAFMQNNEGDEE